MKKAYLLIIDETGKHVRKVVTCEHCVFFKRLSDPCLRSPYICMNPEDGLVHPVPDGFCCYSVPKYKAEAEHE